VSRPDAIAAEGVVIEGLPGNVYRVELANGHRIIARVAGRKRMIFEHLAPPDVVTVELSPFDLSKGIIVFKQNRTENESSRIS